MMNRVRMFLLSVVALVAILTTGIALPTALHGIASEAWWFPGDAPPLDLALWPASIGLACSTFVWWRLGTLGKSEAMPRLPMLAAVFVTVGAAVAFLACSVGIGFRHTAPWANVRRSIRQVGDAIAKDARDRSARLDREEFAALRQKHVPKPIAVDLRGFGGVHLRMAHTIYPYVGVDFGAGRHAFFEPITMICTYSD
jgi:hypothetical protein